LIIYCYTWFPLWFLWSLDRKATCLPHHKLGKEGPACLLSSLFLFFFFKSDAPPVRMERTFASSSSRDLPTISVPSSSSSSLGPSMPTRPVKIIPLQHPNTTTSPSLNPLPGALFSRWTAKVKRTTLAQWIDTFLPCCRWIRTYKWREYFQPDLMAGLTVGVMLVPQVIPLLLFTERICNPPLLVS